MQDLLGQRPECSTRARRQGFYDSRRHSTASRVGALRPVRLTHQPQRWCSADDMPGGEIPCLRGILAGAGGGRPSPYLL
jgi:hypothetical protein